MNRYLYLFQVVSGSAVTRSPKLHPHLIIAGEGEIERVGQVGPARVQSEGRVSTYENVCPPGERDIVPVPAPLPGGVASQESEHGRPNSSAVGLYENVELLRSSRQPGAGLPAQNHTPSSAPSNKRSAQQRRDVYEVVSLDKKKSGDSSTARANGVGTGTRSPENNSKQNFIFSS